MPLERIYRDISINDSANLDSFSKLRISEPSNYDFFDFTYCNSALWGNNVFLDVPELRGLNLITNLSNLDITVRFAGITPPLKFIDNKIVIRRNPFITGVTPSSASIHTRRLIAVTKNSTIKAYISFKLLHTPYDSNRNLWIGIGNKNTVGSEDTKSGFIGLSQSFDSITATNPLGINFNIYLTSTTASLSYSLDKDDWEDKFDGTGPSGITLDFTKIQVLSIEYKSSGHGKVSFGFMVGGKYYNAVTIYNLNTNFKDSLGNIVLGAGVNIRPILNSCRLSAGYTRTGGAALSVGEEYLEIYGGIIFKEEDPTEILAKKVYKFSTSHTYPSTIASGVAGSILRLRKKIGYNGATATYFANTSIDTINFISTANVPLYWELVYDNNTNTIFTSLDTNSLVEFNKPTTFTAKPTTIPTVTIFGGFIAAGESASYKVPESVKNMWQLVQGITGSGAPATYTYFLICVTPIGGGLAANEIRVSITTEETYN